MPDHHKEHGNYFSSAQDSYLDQETGVLKNLQNLKTKEELECFEEIIFQAHFAEATEYLADKRILDLQEWRIIHKICFEDIYDWAGELRSIRIAKGNTIFAYPDTIESEANRLLTTMNQLLDDEKLSFEIASKYFAEINILHPFREGNGRTQRILFNEVFKRIGYQLDYNLTTQSEMIAAMVQAYKGHHQVVIDLFRKIAAKINP